MKMNGLFKEPELPTQPVEVYVNETKVADWQVGDIAVFSAPVPQNFTTAGGTLTFTFKIPKATSPQVLGKGADPRILGICVFEFELSTP